MLSYLLESRIRIPLQVNGPRSLVLYGNQLFAAGYFSGNLEKIDVTPGQKIHTTLYPLGGGHSLSEVQRGEMIFNNAKYCFQQWQSCASCHSADARTDGLNWDLLNDGIGNPKNTKSLLYAHFTPPAMSLGGRENAEISVRAGVKYILFSELPDESLNAIDSYLKSITPIPSPYLKRGKLTAAARRGREVFKKAKCTDCHNGEYFTNMKSYDLGMIKGMDAGKKNDTPTLIELWRTAPYLHDGRASTLHEVFTKYNENDMHGVTSRLSKKELNDLVVYVLSL